MKHLHLALLLCLAAEVDAQVVLNPAPSRLVGHPKLQLTTVAPNYVEGRELNAPQGIAVDSTVNPPILYVSDTGNNRVLGWRDAKSANGVFADVVIGQRDMQSTLGLGPGTATSSGLSSPTGLAVDRNGNLWVVDSGNNRILRFPRPFDQPDTFKLPDLVVGQKNLNSRAANQGESIPNERTLFTSGNNNTFRAAIAFDGSGNMWVTDPGNHRVLRYPASEIVRNEPAADIVLGQLDFISRIALQLTAENRIRKDGFNTPSGIGLDGAGRLYVSDALSRVLVFTPPQRSASRIMGISKLSAPGQPAPPVPNETTLLIPEGIFATGTTPWVVDTGNNRILRFNPFDQWTPEETANFSPAAQFVIGQNDALSGRSNRGQRQPSDSGLSSPTAAAFGGGDLYVADTGNNRVMIFPQQPQNTFNNASRVQGQVSFLTSSPNLVEGRGLFIFAGFFSISGVPAGFANAGGVIIDQRSDPPRLYIADTFNNRVLGYADARRVRPGDTADLVIGQTDFFRATANYPTGDPDQLTETGLLAPSGVAVDTAGNLYVADSGNGRVLRFPSPFAQPPGAVHRANLVLGQSGFTTKNTDATNRTMSRPHGLAFTPEGHLLVSDRGHNRVLFFRRPSGGDFTNGMAAANVFGQPDFQSSIGSNASNRMISPAHIGTDLDARLYVADTGNNRVLIYNTVTNAGPDSSPAVTLTGVANAGDRLGSPHGIYVNDRTGEIWVADTDRQRVVRYPSFNALTLNPFANATVPAQTPLAVAQDAFGSLFIADAANRVVIHFAAVAAINGASFLTRPSSPGMITSLFPFGVRFGEETKSFNELPQPVPLPREIVDIQVLIDDAPVPLYFVSPGQINFLMPMGAPTSGTVEAQVVRRSNGQILAAGPIQMAPATPGLFTESATGVGQVRALNEDNTINSPTNAIPRGQVIQLFGTGQGFVRDAPPDGEPSSGLKPTDDRPEVVIGSAFVPPENIQYSGLAPELIGVWQINVKIPDSTAPGNQVPVAIQFKSIPSTLGTDGRRISTTIAVKAQ